MAAKKQLSDGGTAVAEAPIAKVEDRPLAINQPQRLGIIQGADETDLVIPSAYIYQDTPKDRKTFSGCGFEAGDLVDTMEMRAIASRRFIVLDGYVDYVDGRENAPVRVSRDRSMWPEEDLKFQDKEKPAVTKRLNFICLFEGEEFPLVVRCKKSSMRAGKTLNSMLVKHQGRVVYKLDIKEEDNGKGAYQVPVFKPDGQASPEQYAKAVEMQAKIRGTNVVVDDGLHDGEEDAEFDTDRM